MSGCLFPLIASTIGFIIAGLPGAIIAYVIVSLFTFQKTEFTYKKINRTELNEYLTDVIMLFSHIATIDGSVSRNEVEYVKDFLNESFPSDDELVKDLTAKFHYFNENPSTIDIETAAYGINSRANYNQKIALFSLLVNLSIHSREAKRTFDALTEIGRRLKLNEYDIISLINYYTERNSGYSAATADYYSVLGIQPSASNEEIKKRYKELVKIYHPDKIINMPESFRKDAEEKFKIVNEAYKQIKTERNFR